MQVVVQKNVGENHTSALPCSRAREQRAAGCCKNAAIQVHEKQLDAGPQIYSCRMTPIGTPELVLLLVALGGMTAAATWGVIELKKATKMNLLSVLPRARAAPSPARPNYSSRRRTIGSP